MAAAAMKSVGSWRRNWELILRQEYSAYEFDESGIKESYFHLADEKAGSRLLYRIVSGMTPEMREPSFGSDLISADNLFRFQSEVIRKLAEEQSWSLWDGVQITCWRMRMISNWFGSSFTRIWMRESEE